MSNSAKAVTLSTHRVNCLAGIGMASAFLLRAHDKHSAIFLMRDTLAVIHAEFETPLTAEQFVNAQAVHVFAPVPAVLDLGPYDMDRTRFTRCRMNADLPQVAPTQHDRIDYMKRRQKTQ